MICGAESLYFCVVILALGATIFSWSRWLVELFFFPKPRANKVQDFLLGHFGCDVEVVGIRKASELIGIELFECVLRF